jgi:hypothetical protein
MGNPHRRTDRLDGFRRLLPPLSQLRPDRLKRLASSTRYSGPAQLGPLSDAINATDLLEWRSIEEARARLAEPVRAAIHVLGRINAMEVTVLIS